MSEMKSLAKDTAIYGISSIVGKFLNYLLVPLYTYVLKQTSDYGIVTNLYAWTALLLVILTYGMETGFFRFANREDYQPQQVYKTALLALFSTSTLFAAACVIFAGPLATLLGYEGHSSFISMLGVVVAMDAFSCIPFAYLRYKKRPIAFASLKLLFVFLNIALNLLFLVVLKKTDVTYVFVANLIATGIQTAVLIPMTWPERGSAGPSWQVLKEILSYSLPLLILGVAGIMNQTLDRILFPYIYPFEDAQSQLGIYGACFKVAMVMMMFTQAFRYAYEPFVFSKHKDRQSVAAYADAMKYYVIFSLLILLGVIFYLDLFKYIVSPIYWEGLRIVPIVLWTYVFQGIYFNLSFWYKLTDETRWGAYFSLIGLVITFALQLIFVPIIGYWASCGSSLVCYLVIMLLSYFIGQKKLSIPYDLRSIGGYAGLCLGLLTVYYLIRHFVSNPWLNMLVGTVLIAAYCFVLVRRDFPLSGLPVVGKYFKKTARRAACLLAVVALASTAMADDFSWDKIKHGLKIDLSDYEIVKPELDNYYEELQENLSEHARQCNQLQLTLYGNKTNFIFNITSTIKEVEKMHTLLETNSEPNGFMVNNISKEKDRLQRLLIALLRQAEDERAREELSDSIYAAMDDSLLHAVATQEQSLEHALNRDSCILMVRQLIDAYTMLYERELSISAQYAELLREFGPTYEYMLERQSDIRQQVFHRRDFTYVAVLQRLPLFIEDALDDSRNGDTDWRQMISSGELAIIFGQMFGLLLVAILLGVALRHTRRQFRGLTRYRRNPRVFCNLAWVLLCLLCLLVDVHILHLESLSQAATIFLVYLAFVAIVQISLLIRQTGEAVSAAMHLYAPSLFFGFCTIFMRLFMVPDSGITLLVFPLSLITLIWSIAAFKRYWGGAPRFDGTLAGITLAVFLSMTILAEVGHAFLALVVFLWWQAQEAALLIALALYDRLCHYERNGLVKRKRIYHEKAKSKEVIRMHKGLIQVTWFFDLVKMVGVPFMAIASLPFCMYVALDYFNAGDSYNSFFYRIFYSIINTPDAEPLLQLSCYNFCRIAILFFIFRYVAYFLVSAYEQILLHIELRRSGKEHITTNQVNLTMGVNIIKIVVWAIYITVCCIMLAIPTSALTFIFAGLATGIGFAMRDIINNVFYGMQLMAGRLRVGDYIICGNYRGSVTSISYQTTQMLTEENALVYFPNADLFTKNFMNLTRENPYEVNRVYCNVAYGTDLVLAERLIREAIEPFNEVDKFGRSRLSAKEGIRVEMTNLEDNGIQMAVRFGVIAEQRTWFLPVLRKAIYEKLRAGGIQIPFQQVDIHMPNELKIEN